MRSRPWSIVVLCAGLLLWATGARAQTATPPTPQFDMLGFIQEATLDTGGAICAPTHPRLAGGTMTLNGFKMIVPCNTLLQLPASTMTWADLFDPAVSAPVGTVIGTVAAQGPGQTKLALTDSPAAFPSFEARVQGNVVGNNADGTDRYVIGLISPITQQGFNGSSGLISYIDYKFGSFRVGGLRNDPACVATLPGGGPSCSGALVQINDAADAGTLPDGRLNGRWGLRHSPDPRFSGDFENSTIVAATGIPVCIPRVAPPDNDPLCPLFGGAQNTGNRPRNGDPRFPIDSFLAIGAPLKIFDMPAPSDGVFPDARQQVPMMVGDQVDYAGTLFKIDPLGPATAANTYISAHTVGDNLGIFTAPGIPPAYVSIEDFLIGTNGAPIQGILQEASTRMTVVGFTTDPTRFVDIYAQDINPCTGEETLRLLATEDPSTQPLKGRFVHRVLGGTFMPPTRNYVMKSQTQGVDPVTGQTLVAANGIVTGRFLLPNFEFIFPENHRVGDPLLPFNFQDLPFLAQGSGPVDGFGTGSPILGQLDPWPGIPTPPKANCTTTGAAPIVNAGADRGALSLSQVQLTGTRTLDVNSVGATTLWTQTAGPLVPLASASTLIPTFTAPLVAAGASVPLTFTLTVTDQFGTGTDSVIVTVTRQTDSVAITAATWVSQNGKRGPFGKLAVTATSTDPSVDLTLVEIAVDGSVVNWGTGSRTSPGVYDWVELKGAPTPRSLTVTSSGGGAATVTCSAPDARGRVTCP
jgi:K319-like protein